ncbi:MAG TPA: cation diffusion facilitator family transporter [Gammaproteobacteria bacterium]|nr:cation diffusion facilitator family transporter [Gammaproteobacteria bacterium]
MRKAPSTKTSVYAALAGNLLVALTKTGAAALSGSSSMMSEAVHSFVDTGNEALLLYGIHRAGRPPDPAHPLGHGRELYFWSFVVALLIFAVGAGASVFEGVGHVLRPEPIRSPMVNYVVLGLALVFEGASWLVAVRQFASSKGKLGYLAAFRRSKNPPSFMVLFEDSAALLGILLAAVGTFASSTLGLPVVDGIASILIGVVLGTIAALLARESKSLLIGEIADSELVDEILRIAASQRGVESANGVLTAQLGPDQVVAALSLEFERGLRASDVEDAVLGIERKVREAHPEVVAVFVKPQSDEIFREAVRRRFGGRP